jgi:hypothetical protein
MMITLPPDLEYKQKDSLTEILSRFESLSTVSRRDEVVHKLPHEIRNKITRRDNTWSDLYAILNTCLSFPDGVGRLFEILQRIEGETIHWKNLEVEIGNIDSAGFRNDSPANYADTRVLIFGRCNRDHQTGRFEERIYDLNPDGSPQLLVFLIHGQDAEAHDLMMDRLEAELKQAAEGLSSGPFRSVVLPEPPKPKQKLEVFWSKYRAKLISQTSDTRERAEQKINTARSQIMSYIKEWRSLHLLRLTYHVRDFNRTRPHPDDLKPYWESAAEMVAGLDSGQFLVWLVSIVDGGSTATREPDDDPEWLGEWKEYEKNLSSANGPVVMTILPRLKSVEYHYASRWCDIFPPETRERLRREVISYYQLRNDAPVPMRDLVNKLSTITPKSVKPLF